MIKKSTIIKYVSLMLLFFFFITNLFNDNLVICPRDPSPPNAPFRQ